MKLCSKCGVHFGKHYDMHSVVCDGSVYKEVQVCEFCGLKAYGFGFNAHRRYCAGNPDRDLSIRNNSRSQTGKVLSNEHRANLSKSSKGMPKLPGTVGAKKGSKRSNETKAKISLSLTGRTPSPETRQRLSASASVRASSRGSFSHVKTYYAINRHGVEYSVQGRWELDVADWLTDQGILWEKNHLLEYQLGELRKSYNPDFYLPELDCYIEVKGHYPQEAKDKMRLVLERNNVKIHMLHKPEIEAVRSGKSYAQVIHD